MLSPKKSRKWVKSKKLLLCRDDDSSDRDPVHLDLLSRVITTDFCGERFLTAKRLVIVTNPSGNSTRMLFSLPRAVTLHGMPFRSGSTLRQNQR
jgi:hypothetical protein